MPDTTVPADSQTSAEETARGEGDELHQLPGGDVPVMTSANGTPLSDDENSLRVAYESPAFQVSFHADQRVMAEPC